GVGAAGQGEQPNPCRAADEQHGEDNFQPFHQHGQCDSFRQGEHRGRDGSAPGGPAGGTRRQPAQGRGNGLAGSGFTRQQGGQQPGGQRQAAPDQVSSQALAGPGQPRGDGAARAAQFLSGLGVGPP